MIAGIFHEGSGLGNQLHRYVATRVLAEDKGYEWTMMNLELFKGSSFMNLEIMESIEKPKIVHFNPMFSDTMPQADDVWLSFNEKKVVENGVDIRSYDPEINFVEDGTIIDGEFQDPRYFEHKLDDIREWLKVEPLEMSDDVCVIGFRGGEFSIFPDLFLTEEYWKVAIGLMKTKYPNILFDVHTDDPITAARFFPDFPITHEIGLNWRSVRYAKHLIIANSSFYILPALLGNAEEVIAPRYWARHNTGVWALPQNYYKQFFYI